MVSSHNATSPCDLLQGLVAGTSPIVCADLKAINKLCVREILSLSFVCGAYFFEFRGRNLVCFVVTYNFNGKYVPEAGKTRMRTAFFTRAVFSQDSWIEY